MACSLTVYVYNYESLVIFTMTVTMPEQTRSDYSSYNEGVGAPIDTQEAFYRQASSEDSGLEKLRYVLWAQRREQANVQNTSIASCEIGKLPLANICKLISLIKPPHGNPKLDQLENQCKVGRVDPVCFEEAVCNYIYRAFNDQFYPDGCEIRAYYETHSSSAVGHAPSSKQSSFGSRQSIDIIPMAQRLHQATLLGFIVFVKKESKRKNDPLVLPHLIVPVAPKRRMSSEEGLMSGDNEVRQLLTVARRYRELIEDCAEPHHQELSLKRIDGVNNLTLMMLLADGFGPAGVSMESLLRFGRVHRSCLFSTYRVHDDDTIAQLLKQAKVSQDIETLRYRYKHVDVSLLR